MQRRVPVGQEGRRAMSDDEIRQAIAAGLCDESIDHEFRSSQDCIERPCCLDICRGIHTERVPCGEYVEAMVEPVFARLVPLFARAEKAEAALNKVLLLLRKPGSPPPLPLEMEVEYWVREVKAEVARLREALTLRRNDEGIWLHIKTDKMQAAVLIAGSDSTHGPITMAALEAALEEAGR